MGMNHWIWHCESHLWPWQDLMTRVVGKKNNKTKQPSMVGSQGNRKRIGHSGYGWVSSVEILIKKETKKEENRLNESWVQTLAFLMTSREEKNHGKGDRGDNCRCNQVNMRGQDLGRHWP